MGGFTGYKKYSVDEAFFKCIDSESKAYALGFLLTDGHVHKNGKRIYFKSTDFDVLEKLKDSLRYTGPLLLANKEVRNWKECRVLQINRKSMVKDLSNIGIFNNKNETAPWLNLDHDLQRHFIRGLIDGDGSFGRIEGRGLGVSSVFFRFTTCSKNLNEGLKSYLESVGFPVRFYIHSALKYNSNFKYKDQCILHATGKWAMGILSLAYGNASIFMNRKMNSYQELNAFEFKTRSVSVSEQNKLRWAAGVYASAPLSALVGT